MNALVVCHAGSGLGLGHLTRALVVAVALHQELGANVHLLIQGGLVQRTDLNKFEHQFIGFEVNLVDAVRQRVREVKTLVMVLDLHPRFVPTNIDKLLADIRSAGCRVIGVDGLVCHRNNLDMIFIPSFRFLPPGGSSGAPILFGWDCFLLNVKHSPGQWKHGKHVLVLTGGSDATGLGRHLPILLNKELPVTADLHWVTGPYAQQPVWPVSPRFSMFNHQAPPGLDDLMVGANYAVTVYGVSFFELLYYGVPTVVFSPYGNKDDEELIAVAESGVALVARDEVEAVAKLKELMADDKMATTLSRQARNRMSVLGGNTFAQAVTGLLA